MAKVEIPNIEPNSNSYKEKKVSDKKEKLDPVVRNGGVVSTKKPLSKKLTDTFIKQDIEDVKSYILMDVVIPGLKNLILDGLSMVFFGEVRKEKSRGRNYYDRDQRTNYSSYYRSGRSSSHKEKERYIDDKIDYQNIVLRYREDAEEVIDKLRGQIRDQGSASVADLFNLIDVAGKFTDNNWGWTRENQVGIKRVRDGFLIDVEEAEYLD